MTTDCGLRGLPLLDAVIAHIEAHPETWNQKVYRCETGMCAAGWTAEMAGGQWLNTIKPNASPSMLVATSEDDYGDVLSGGRIHAEDRARRLLGLDEWAADELFADGNDLDDIKRIRDEIAAGAQ